MNEATKIMRKLYVFAEDEQGNAYYSQICDEHFATFLAGLASSCAPFIPIEAVGPLNIKPKRKEG